MGKEQQRRGSVFKRSVVIILGLVLIVGLAAPYWLGQRIEQKYADYLQQLQRFGYIEVENLVYERGWLEANAAYELVLEPEFAQFYTGLLSTAVGQEFEGEPLRIHVDDQITHGPFIGAFASIEGRADASGWLFDQLVQMEVDGSISRYDARVGFDQVVVGEWAPMQMVLTAGPLLSDAGLDLRYDLDYQGGDFRYDPSLGEYRSSNRMGPARLEEPSATHTFEGSTAEFVASFPEGVLRDVMFSSQDGPIVTESRDVEWVGDSRIDAQSVDIQLQFDEQGRFEGFTTRYALQGFEAEEPELFLTMQDMGAEITASRQDETSWYGQLDVSLEGLTLRELDSPSFEVQDMHYRLGLEPESAAHFRVAQLLAASGLRIQGVNDPIALHVESSYGQLPRAQYDTLWGLIHEAVGQFSWEDPDRLLPVFERMERVGEELLAGRSTISVKPFTFSMGEADIDLQLEADMSLVDLAAFENDGLLAPESRLDLSVNASERLLHKMFRESLRQQLGGLRSDSELDAMAKEAVADSLEAMLELGVVRREEDERYSLEAQLRDGQLLLNGEPGEWLLEQF
ncbi:DUF945 family protein [Halomonas salipaludis]|uniref:DUF945 domain-containing protein n=1 Tax=Halomonas salipaludis TaxID=2032625 RepID=A0A2A2EW30_9GAMM|nr:DUF945 family protein [Halomonas salipaludis]PAU77336.1 hypothetical protein CK498_08840 [Halomonas salipaludis]